MKQFILICIIGITMLILAIAIAVNASSNPFPLLGKMIIIDPGHGGKDPGAVVGDIKEKDINLAVSLILEEKLLNLGAIVYLTRSKDYDLATPGAHHRKRSDILSRVRVINNANPDLYLSIHVNAYNSNRWYGANVYFDDVNPKNELIAKTFQEGFKKDLKSPRSAMRVSHLLMQRLIKPPGVLIEVGFISNPHERNQMTKKSYQTKLANSITNSILRLNQEKSI